MILWSKRFAEQSRDDIRVVKQFQPRIRRESRLHRRQVHLISPLARRFHRSAYGVDSGRNTLRSSCLTGYRQDRAFDDLHPRSRATDFRSVLDGSLGHGVALVACAGCWLDIGGEKLYDELGPMEINSMTDQVGESYQVPEHRIRLMVHGQRGCFWAVVCAKQDRICGSQPGSFYENLCRHTEEYS